MKTILSVESVSKTFRIRHAHEPYLTLRDSVKDIFRRKNSDEVFYALRDVSFEVKEGESLGIIGKNGAGKSTLLKILSRITPPTTGRILSYGRIASLLEVGTGFHPELTGRENIFLNGSILGLKRKEIKSRLKEIIDFSGVEKFLDTPLKHYSSGMQLRLAFAVAAHLDPEIMVIDEVLAVGDAEFQKKCMGKMETISKSGRTLLFVSHNLAALNSLCSRSLMLDKGNLICSGNTADVIDRYLEFHSVSVHKQTGMGAFILNEDAASPKILRSVMIFNDGKPANLIRSGSSAEFIISCNARQVIQQPVIGLVVTDHFGTSLIGINNRHYGISLPAFQGEAAFKIVFQKFPLVAGTYKLDFFIGDGITDLESTHDPLTLHVESSDLSGTGTLVNSKLNRMLIPDVEWSNAK